MGASFSSSAVPVPYIGEHHHPFYGIRHVAAQDAKGWKPVAVAVVTPRHFVLRTAVAHTSIPTCRIGARPYFYLRCEWFMLKYTQKLRQPREKGIEPSDWRLLPLMRTGFRTRRKWPTYLALPLQHTFWCEDGCEAGADGSVKIAVNEFHLAYILSGEEEVIEILLGDEVPVGADGLGTLRWHLDFARGYNGIRNTLSIPLWLAGVDGNRADLPTDSRIPPPCVQEWSRGYEGMVSGLRCSYVKGHASRRRYRYEVICENGWEWMSYNAKRAHLRKTFKYVEMSPRAGWTGQRQRDGKHIRRKSVRELLGEQEKVLCRQPKSATKTPAVDIELIFMEEAGGGFLSTLWGHLVSCLLGSMPPEATTAQQHHDGVASQNVHREKEGERERHPSFGSRE
ncbi:hypothetical protein RJ55_06773 [Drechmeria coniospora]|nr:hypothetical protein RJ55_06773 [Drechmeria coniospora]